MSRGEEVAGGAAVGCGGRRGDSAGVATGLVTLAGALGAEPSGVIDSVPAVAGVAVAIGVIALALALATAASGAVVELVAASECASCFDP